MLKYHIFKLLRLFFLLLMESPVKIQFSVFQMINPFSTLNYLLDNLRIRIKTRTSSFGVI